MKKNKVIILILFFGLIFINYVYADTPYLPIEYKTVRYKHNGFETNVWYIKIPAKYKMHYSYGSDKLFGIEKPSANATRHGATFAINTQFLGFPSVNGTKLSDGANVANYDFYIEKNEKSSTRYDIFNVFAVDKFSEKKGISFKDINLGYDYDGDHVPYSSSYSGVKNNEIYIALFSQLVMNGELTPRPNKYVVTRHPRSWLAYDSNGNQYVATCAGRDAPLLDGTRLSQAGLNYMEMYEFTKQYMTSDIKTMYNLDGGGSTSFVYKGKKINPNYDNNNTVERSNYGAFYWKVEQYKIKIHNYIEGTKTNPQGIKDSESIKNDGDTYKVTPSKSVKGYSYYKSNGSLSGTVTKNIEIINYYKKNAFSVKNNLKLSNNIISNINAGINLTALNNNFSTNGSLSYTDSKGTDLGLTNNVKTGFKLKCKYDNEESAYTISVVGDVLGEGKISNNGIKKSAKHIIEKNLLKNEYLKSADLNNDGKVKMNDVMIMAKRLKTN